VVADQSQEQAAPARFCAVCRAAPQITRNGTGHMRASRLLGIGLIAIGAAAPISTAWAAADDAAFPGTFTQNQPPCAVAA